jgi:hypothetical protein
VSPISLLWFALQSHLFLVWLAVSTLAVVVAFVVFGGGWR